MAVAWVIGLAVISGCARLTEDWGAARQTEASRFCALSGSSEHRVRHQIDDGTSVLLNAAVTLLGEGPGHSTRIFQLGSTRLSFRYRIAETADYWASQRSNGLRLTVDGVDAELFAFRDWSGHRRFALLPIARPDLPVAKISQDDEDFDDAACALKIMSSIRWGKGERSG